MLLPNSLGGAWLAISSNHSDCPVCACFSALLDPIRWSFDITSVSFRLRFTFLMRYTGPNFGCLPSLPIITRYRSTTQIVPFAPLTLFLLHPIRWSFNIICCRFFRLRFAVLMRYTFVFPGTVFRRSLSSPIVLGHSPRSWTELYMYIHHDLSLTPSPTAPDLPLASLPTIPHPCSRRGLVHTSNRFPFIS